MAHVAICGRTMMGKTTLALELARRFQTNGFGCLVLDPILDPRWQLPGNDNFFMTQDQHEFLERFWNSQSCAVFIDEAAEVVGQYDKTLVTTATRGRHLGHRCHYSIQRYKNLNAIVRGQCTTLYTFNVSKEESSEMAKVFDHKDKFDELSSYPPGQYLRVTANNQPPVQGRIF